MFLSPPNFVWAIRVKTHRRGSRSGHELAANPRAWHASPPTTRSEGAYHERERPQEATARRTDEWERLLPLPGSAEAFFLTQAVSTVGTEPAGI